jgi:hypothetical protein
LNCNEPPPTDEKESAELISLEENLEYKAKLAETKQKAQLLLRPASAPPSLQNQCRRAINQLNFEIIYNEKDSPEFNFISICSEKKI